MTPSDGKIFQSLDVYLFFSIEPSRPPERVALTVISAIEISVTWAKVPPIHENGIIETYEVLYQPLEAYDMIQVRWNTTNLSILLTALHEYANYSIQVRAYTDAGPGPYSDQEFARTNEAGLSMATMLLYQFYDTKYS